jgi:alpha-tubulin suppressor-like RCC1 family protein
VNENLIVRNSNQYLISENTMFDDLLPLLSPKIISKFRNNEQIESNFVEKIKFSFHFKDYDVDYPHLSVGINSLIVTDGGKVLTFGNNSNGLLDQNHKNANIEPLIVNELSHKKVIDFANGFSHLIGRTIENEVYIWGYNGCGQLGTEQMTTVLRHI